MIEEREDPMRRPLRVMNLRKHTELLCIGFEFDPIIAAETQSPLK